MTATEYGPISSVFELEGVRDEIATKHPERTMLYRGQCNLYPKIRSGRARTHTQLTSPALEQGWISLASMLLDTPLHERDLGLVKAVLQHYGSPTYFVDLTSDIGIASWFATNAYREQTNPYVGNSFRFIKHAHYTARTDGTAYVLVLAVDAEALKSKGALYDLSCLPKEVTRPHRQKGWLMLDRPPVLPTPNDFWVATIKIDCSKFQGTAPLETIFPPPRDDRAYAAIRGFPFVQIPTAYFEDPAKKGDQLQNPGKAPGDTETEDNSDIMRTFCFAERALDLCDYGNMMDASSYDHKWEDYTLYEPPPMRMWKHWRFDLETLHEGIQGTIGQSTKITIAPRALEVLESAVEAPCEWLDIGTSNLLYIFAVLDHDKLIEHSPPYDGVWLHKSDDFVLETPVQADHDVLSVFGGHGYTLRNGTIQRQMIAKACICADPQSHDQRVQKVLRISALVESGDLILVPHPRIPDWYIVL